MLGMAPGRQRVALQFGIRIVGCEEANCEWFLKGKEGMDEGAPFRHPAGVQCGDHRGCIDPNCPCPQRLTWDLQRGFRGHAVPNHNRPPLYTVATQQGRRQVVEDEWLYRLHEGADTVKHILTRGL